MNSPGDLKSPGEFFSSSPLEKGGIKGGFDRKTKNKTPGYTDFSVYPKNFSYDTLLVQMNIKKVEFNLEETLINQYQ